MRIELEQPGAVHGRDIDDAPPCHDDFDIELHLDDIDVDTSQAAADAGADDTGTGE